MIKIINANFKDLAFLKKLKRTSRKEERIWLSYQ